MEETVTISRESYDELKEVSRSLLEMQGEYKRLDYENAFMPLCLPPMLNKLRASMCNSIPEIRYYTLLEMLQGKHNDYLQYIIDESKKDA